MSTVSIGVLDPNNTSITEDAVAYTVDASTGSFNGQLPVAIAGNSFIFSRIDTSSNNVSLLPQSGDTINGQSSLALLPGAMVRLVYFDNLTDWVPFVLDSNANKTEYIRLSTLTGLSSLTTNYIGTGGFSTTESAVQTPITRSCTFNKMTVFLSALPNALSSRTLTLRQGTPGSGASNTALTVTFTNASSLVETVTGSVSFSAGDLLSVASSVTGLSITTATVAIVLECI